MVQSEQTMSGRRIRPRHRKFRFFISIFGVPPLLFFALSLSLWLRSNIRSDHFSGPTVLFGFHNYDQGILGT
jgi:hypothetical protein